MAKYIWGQKNGIHVVDISHTQTALQQAVDFLTKVAAEGEIIFVGTKRQAATIILEQANRAGAHYIIDRWPGGMLTNFKMSQRSLRRLNELEKAFEEGVEGRTKYEVSRMKVEWQRLNRLYGGVKKLTAKPAAVVVVDPRYEKVAVRECRRMHIPVVALTDTNCDPAMVDYCIPGNDDAIKAITLVVETLASAVLEGNKGNGVKHEVKDYSAVEVKVLKASELDVEDKAELPVADKPVVISNLQAPRPFAGGAKNAGKGILQIAKEQALQKESDEVKPKAVKTKAAGAKPKAKTKSKAK